MARKKLDKLQPGQEVWSIERVGMGNTTLSYNALYRVRVIEIDAEGRRVLASWNSNKPRWYSEETVSKWKLEEPKPKGKIFGHTTY